MIDRSRRPYRQTNKLRFQIERCIIGIKREHPAWGAPKIRDKLIRELPMSKPPAIRTDNGVPFASGNALFGLSRLAAWWLRLGIDLQSIKPGNPQQNGRHERMHLTLKKETTKPASYNFLQQQERFDKFIHYNNERPSARVYRCT
jgi:transposase InsO family protein